MRNAFAKHTVQLRMIQQILHDGSQTQSSKYYNRWLYTILRQLVSPQYGQRIQAIWKQSFWLRAKRRSPCENASDCRHESHMALQEPYFISQGLAIHSSSKLSAYRQFFRAPQLLHSSMGNEMLSIPENLLFQSLQILLHVFYYTWENRSFAQSRYARNGIYRIRAIGQTGSSP